jgi:hypothetical protein
VGVVQVPGGRHLHRMAAHCVYRGKGLPALLQSSAKRQMKRLVCPTSFKARHWCRYFHATCEYIWKRWKCREKEQSHSGCCAEEQQSFVAHG